nr:LmeA family phospholipid-binding protein [Actinomycetota bacterium]
EFPRVTMTASGVDKGGVVFSKVSVVLRRVSFTFPRALTGGHGTVRAASGSGTAELTGEDLTSALRAHDIPSRSDSRTVS